MANKVRLQFGGKTYWLKSLDFTLPELAAVQRHTGLLFQEFRDGITDPSGNALALMGLLWLVRRRSGDYVKWAAFEESLNEPNLFATFDIDIVPDDEATAQEDDAAPENEGEEAPAEPDPPAATAS